MALGLQGRPAVFWKLRDGPFGAWINGLYGRIGWVHWIAALLGDCKLRCCVGGGIVLWVLAPLGLGLREHDSTTTGVTMTMS